MSQLAQRKVTPAGSPRSAAYRRAIVPWLMMAPAMAVLAGFIIYPAFNAIYVSLTDTNLLNLSAQTFVGLDNYISLFRRDDFRESLRNSAVWTFGNVAFQLVLGMIGALILNARFKGRGAIRGIVLLPWATPSVLVALMWLWMLDPNLGIINHLLEAVGLQQGKPIAWLADQHRPADVDGHRHLAGGALLRRDDPRRPARGARPSCWRRPRIDGANAWQIVLARWSCR